MKLDGKPLKVCAASKKIVVEYISRQLLLGNQTAKCRNKSRNWQQNFAPVRILAKQASDSYLRYGLQPSRHRCNTYLTNQPSKAGIFLHNYLVSAVSRRPRQGERERRQLPHDGRSRCWEAFRKVTTAQHRNVCRAGGQVHSVPQLS